MEAKKKIKPVEDKLKKPLMEKEDYPDFVRQMMYAESGQLIKFSFDVYQTLKTIADIIAPFSWLFIKDPRLKQAFELIHNVLKEKRAELSALQVKSELDVKYRKQLHNVISDLEYYLNETGLSINDLSKKDLQRVLRGEEK